MAQARFRPEERIGLALAVAAHVGVIALLMTQRAPPPPPPPERMTVSLSADVGLTAAAPHPAKSAQQDIAPMLGQAQPQPSQPLPAPPSPQPIELPLPTPREVHVDQPAPAPPPPEPRPAKPVPHLEKPAPTKPAPARPAPAHPSREAASEDPIAAALAGAKAHPPAKAQPQTKPAPAKPAKSAPQPQASAPAKPAPRPEHAKAVGGQNVGADFLKGMTSANTTAKSDEAPSLAAGPDVVAGLRDAISRQLKPKWVAPTGADADKLVTVVGWDLNRDGSLVGSPHVVSQTGITDSNRPQAARTREMAVRAVEMAAPFTLPPQYFSTWKHATWRFDWNMSQ